MSTTYFAQNEPVRKAVQRRYSTFVPTGLANRISLIPAMKSDPGSHVTMTFSKATRLFSRCSNSGKSSSSSRDSRAFISATARKSLACDATVGHGNVTSPTGLVEVALHLRHRQLRCPRTSFILNLIQVICQIVISWIREEIRQNAYVYDKKMFAGK